MTRDTAAHIAALQWCIQNPGEFNPITIDGMSSLLPKDSAWLKDEKFPETVKQLIRKLVNLSTVNAQYRFIQIFRNLPTYGTTFFLVSRTERGSKIPVEEQRLGVNREEVMLLDINSSELVRKIPLSSIKKWATSGNFLLLDLGNDEVEYFQTEDASAISHLISGYIDIRAGKKTDEPSSSIEGKESIPVQPPPSCLRS